MGLAAYSIFIGSVILSVTSGYAQTVVNQKKFVLNELAVTMHPSRKMIYKKTKANKLSLDIFNPSDWKATDRRTAIIVFHGGGWIKGKPWEYYPFAAYFSKRGMVGICVEYGLIDTLNPVPPISCIKDARTSIRFIRKHAADLGIDTTKIIVTGISAGGHLAIGTALFDEINEIAEDRSISCMPNGIILYSPVIDTSPKGYGNKICGPYWRELSPVDRIIQGLPPCLIFHGTADNVTPYVGVLQFQKGMGEKGNYCKVITTHDVQHTWFRHDLAVFYNIMKQSCNFLSEQKFAQQQVCHN